MLSILPYKKELLEGFIYDGIESNLTGKDIGEMVEFYAELGKCFMGIVDNKVIGIGGIYPLWHGAGSVFLFMNKEAEKYKVSIFKALLSHIPILVKEYEIKTLIVNCLSDSLKANNLITHLGFIKNKEIKMAMYIKRENI